LRIISGSKELSFSREEGNSTQLRNSPGALVRNMGGGGRLVPLIGDTQQFSSISSCSTDKYDEMTQNSSKLMLGASQLIDDDDDVDEDDDVEVVDDEEAFSTSRTKLKMRFKLSKVMRSLRYPRVEST